MKSDGGNSNMSFERDVVPPPLNFALCTQMMKIEKPQPIIAWGILIGCCLGLMEAGISIWMWHAFAQPDFLFRAHDLELSTAISTIGGFIAGYTYGLIVKAHAERRQMRINLFALYMCLMFLGVLVYTSVYWLVLRFGLPLFYVPDVVLFVVALLLPGHFKQRDMHNI